jgi:hypothetical protein
MLRGCDEIAEWKSLIEIEEERHGNGRTGAGSPYVSRRLTDGRVSCHGRQEWFTALSAASNCHSWYWQMAQTRLSSAT